MASRGRRASIALPALILPAEGEQPAILTPPTRRRRRELRFAFLANVNGTGGPYAGVAIRTMGELLWVLIERGWEGGLTPRGTEQFSRAMRWFERARSRHTPRGHADLRGADLRYAVLRHVDFQHADLSGANLLECDLRGVILAHAQLDGTVLQSQRLADVTLISETRAETLTDVYERNHAEGSPPYAGAAIGSRHELLWMMRQRGWMDSPDVDLRAVDLRATTLSDLDLDEIDLSQSLIIDPERAQELRAQYAARDPMSDSPYKNIPIRTRLELVFILHERGWTGVPSANGRQRPQLCAANLSGGDFSGACLCEADLRYAALERASLTGTILSGANLVDAQAAHAGFDRSNLQKAEMRAANFAEASFTYADLRDADLRFSDLSGSVLLGADARGADLRRAAFTARTLLGNIALDTGTRLGEINWSAGVSLAGVDWKQTPILGDETRISTNSSQMERRREYRAAESAYRALATALRQQGLHAEAIPYHVRELRLQRRQMRIDHRYLAWAFSHLLDLVVGYGGQPWRSLILFPIVLAGFTGLYLLLPVIPGAHFHGLTLDQAFMLSLDALVSRSSQLTETYQDVWVLQVLETACGWFILLIFTVLVGRRIVVS